MMKINFIFFIIFSVFSFQANAQGSCMHDIRKVMTATSEIKGNLHLAKDASTALKRNLTENEIKALSRASTISGHEVYTTTEILQQEKILKKAKFSDNEIQLLRKKNVLTNSILKFSNGAPTGVEVRQIALKEIDANDLKNLKSGKSINYLVGQDGKMYVTSESIKFPKDKIVMATNAYNNEITDTTSSSVVREAGKIFFDNQNSSYTFKPSYGFDTSKPETKEMIKQVKEIVPGANVVRRENSAIPHSRVIKCLDILSAQTGGKNFVMDKMISDNMVTTSAIIGSELMGAGRLNTAQGRAVVESDIIGGNITGLIGAQIGKKLIVRNSNFMTSMAVRTGMGLSMIELQKQITKGVIAAQPSLQEQGENTIVVEPGTQDTTAEDIAAFNRAHFFARLPVNHYLDNFMVKTLPNLVFNTCQKNPVLSVLVSPRSVRLYERYASSVIYFGLRESIIGQ